MTKELHSRRGLAWRIGIPLQDLVAIATDVERSYREFRIKRPGKDDRVIDNPNARMKEIQSRTRKILLEPLPLDDSAHGCVKGRSSRTNSEVHCGQRNLARIDVKHCFPSVTNRMVYRLLRQAGFGPRVASLLTVLLTRKGHIPQGAPSSDRLANLVLRGVDQRVREIAGTLNLQNRRFVDDFTLSGDNTREAIGQVIAALRTAGFAVGHDKTSNAGACKPHIVAGYSATHHGLKITREKQQHIRTRVYQTVRAHRRGESIDAAMRSVRGSLSYLRPTNPGLVRRLERQLTSAGIAL
jgi:RNA-directed DNA polymerase